MTGTVTGRYGIPLPLDALFAAIEDRYGEQARCEMEAIYDAAHRRYARANRLLEFERDVRRGPMTTMSEERLAYRRRCLADPQGYIDGLIEPPEGRKPDA
jgi:hypothetical protein